MQTLLFPELIEEAKRISIGVEDYLEAYHQEGLAYEFVDISDVTFKAGLSEPVHSWFRLTPSYSPELVRFFINYLECNPNHQILDPFNGKGTTIIECQKLNYSSMSVEINPLLYYVTEKSLKWEYDVLKLEKAFRKIQKDFEKIKAASRNLSVEEFERKYNVSIPRIHNPFRWWKKDVLKELLILKQLVRELDSEFAAPFEIATTVIALDCANIHRNHPTISFDDNHNRNIRVWLEFESKFNSILNDIKIVQSFSKNAQAKVVLGDSTEIEKFVDGKKFDRVITSPPYPNRFSYIHTTRPQLFFMEIIKDANEATEVDLKAIGGTWGRATSILEKEFLKPNEGIEDCLTYINELLPKSLLMCNYATKYFNMMHDHIKSLKQVINKGFKGVYVVGNSRLTGVEIHTEIILAKIFQKEGFTFDKIAIFRKRGGKTKLFETGVCVSF